MFVGISRPIENAPSLRAALELLGERNRDGGVTMLIASAFPGELLGLATDYLFLDEGRLLGSMTAREAEQLAEDPEKLASELLRLRAEREGGGE